MPCTQIESVIPPLYLSLQKQTSASHCVMAVYRQPCHCGKLIPLHWHHPSPGETHIYNGSFSCIAESAIRFTLGEDTNLVRRRFDLEASSAWRS
uniref:Uncharacterized protein n=1 Tax=Solanum lycopersicum TaxID=4081 RepID=A0A3Q7GHR1_SOLLC